MQLARCEGDGQRLAGAQQVTLADDLVNGPRPQALGERGRCGGRRNGEQVGHGVPGQGVGDAEAAALPRTIMAGRVPTCTRPVQVRRSTVRASPTSSPPHLRMRDNPLKSILAGGGRAYGAMAFEFFSPWTAADLRQRRRRIHPLRHGAHRPVVRDAEDAVRAVPRPAAAADGPGAARRVSLHRPRGTDHQQQRRPRHSVRSSSASRHPGVLPGMSVRGAGRRSRGSSRRGSRHGAVGAPAAGRS